MTYQGSCSIVHHIYVNILLILFAILLCIVFSSLFTKLVAINKGDNEH